MDLRLSRYPQSVQIWQGTPTNPYPMNFTQAPSFGNQLIVDYQGKPNLQCLSTVRGPFMFPVRVEPIRRPMVNLRGPVVYPITHSIPDPYQQSFINLSYRYYPRKCAR